MKINQHVNAWTMVQLVHVYEWTMVQLVRGPEPLLTVWNRIGGAA